MKIRRHSNFYNFIGDTETGTTFRWGKTFKDNPLFAPWPELADISISNHCTMNCDYCYRDSKPDNSFMNIDDYDFVLKSLSHPHWGNVFQVALGGGEPLEHPDFIDIINLTNKYKIVPNFTTNGCLISEDIVSLLQGRVGAIAVSINDISLISKTNIELLMESNIKTNLHFILSDSSIEHAVDILMGKYNEMIPRLNAIIFLTYKPAGRAAQNHCLKFDSRLRKFISLIDNNNCRTRIGFDACFVPLLLHYTNTETKFVDSCECGYFSIYIDEQLNVKPCSFTNNMMHSFNLRESTLDEIWEKKFEVFRKSNLNNCTRSCKNQEHCRGGCPYFSQINFCYSSAKEGTEES